MTEPRISAITPVYFAELPNAGDTVAALVAAFDEALMTGMV